MASRDEQSWHKFLEGPKQRAMLRALFPQDVFITAQHSIRAPVTLHSCHYHGKINALIDSGATDNFISPFLVKKYRIDTHTLENPLTVRNVDGTANRNGSANEMVTLHVKYDGETTLHLFYSGLKNCCNVLQFQSGCDVALDRVRLMLSVGEIK